MTHAPPIALVARRSLALAGCGRSQRRRTTAATPAPTAARRRRSPHPARRRRRAQPTSRGRDRATPSRATPRRSPRARRCSADELRRLPRLRRQGRLMGPNLTDTYWRYGGTPGADLQVDPRRPAAGHAGLGRAPAAGPDLEAGRLHRVASAARRRPPTTQMARCRRDYAATTDRPAGAGTGAQSARQGRARRRAAQSPRRHEPRRRSRYR